MKIKTETFTVESAARFEVLNISPEIQKVIEAFDAKDGLVYIRMPHTSAALATNEYEAKLVDDMIDKFKELAPPDDGYYHDLDHITAGEQPNAHAHLLAGLIGQPVLVVLRDGDLDLGTWEEVMFFEFCGPRTRTVEVTVLT